VGVDPEEGGGKGRRFWREEMVKERLVEVRGGGGAREGGELVRVPPFSEPLGRPHCLGVDFGEEGLPVFGLSPLYGLEVDSFGGAGLREGGGARVTSVCARCAVEVLA